MADETGPGLGRDAQGPREDRLFLVASAWSTGPLFRPRRPARRHALDRESPPERRWAEQRDGTRTPRHLTNPRRFADRRRRTEWHGPARRRRPVFAPPRGGPLPTHPRGFPPGTRAPLPVPPPLRPCRTPPAARLRRPPNGTEPVRCALEPSDHDPPDRGRRCGQRARPEGRDRLEHQPRRRERLRHVRRPPARADDHPRHTRDRPGGVAADEGFGGRRGDDLREEGLMDEVHLGDASIKILPVVRGLSSEIPIVADAINTTAPNVVAVSIGPEELQTLRAYHGGPLDPENFEEEIYVAGLSAWETPTKPPPCFTEAIRVADRRAARLEALDMDEVTYTETYVNCVSGLEVVFQGRLERRLRKKQFRATTPRDFVIEWDAEVNGPPGFAQLQARREAHMAGRLREIAASAPSVLAVIEVERVRGVLAAIRA